MSTAAVSTSLQSLSQQSYIQQRQGDLKQLGLALQSGNLAGARQIFNTIQNFAAQNSPFAKDNAFAIKQREQDFTAIGQALRSGDLAGAQQAFDQLKSTFLHRTLDPGPAANVTLSQQSGGPASSNSASSTGSPTGTSAGGAEIILNVGNGSGGGGSEQITINLNNPATGSPSSTASSAGTPTGGPEIILNVGNSSGSGSSEQININLTNTNNGGEQITIGIGTQQSPNAEQVTLKLAQNSNEQIILNLLGNTPAASSQSSGVNVVA